MKTNLQKTSVHYGVCKAETEPDKDDLSAEVWLSVTDADHLQVNEIFIYIYTTALWKLFICSL